MAWCGVVEPRTLRECRIALGQSQAAFAAMLGVSLESYRTWDAGRRATPPKILARARALATHRDDHALLPLPVLALLIGCFRHQLLLPRPYLVLTKPLRLDIQCQRGASVKIGWKYLDD